MCFRVYLQYQKEGFLWVSSWADLCLTQQHIQMKPKRSQTHLRNLEETQTQYKHLTETHSILLTNQISHTLSWHRWRAGANLYHSWITTQWRKSTPTSSAAPPSQHQHLIHPIQWRGSPATPTPFMMPGLRGWVAAAQKSRVMILKSWGPTPCTSPLKSLEKN